MKESHVTLLVVAAFLFLIFLAIAGCTSCNAAVRGWDLGELTPTGIVPTVGEYKFVTDKNINDSAHRTFVFSVEQDPDQSLVVVFSSNGVRSDRIPVKDGAFYYTWGEILGYHSPTDAYGICGHFTDKGKAEGTIKLGNNGHLVSGATAFFIATFVPPPDPSAIWKLDKYAPTDIIPDNGDYIFETDHPITDATSHPKLSFHIRENVSNGNPTLIFWADGGYRCDYILIENGAFYWTWGEIGGTNNPTDSYGISGHFVSKTQAEGVIKLAYSGKIFAEATFVATLNVPYPYP